MVQRLKSLALKGLGNMGRLRGCGGPAFGGRVARVHPTPALSRWSQVHRVHYGASEELNRARIRQLKQGPLLPTGRVIRVKSLQSTSKYPRSVS